MERLTIARTRRWGNSSIQINNVYSALRSSVRMDDVIRMANDMISKEQPITNEEIDTVGGLVFCLAGKVPKKEEVFQYKNFLKLKILSATDRRINTLEIDKI